MGGYWVDRFSCSAELEDGRLIRRFAWISVLVRTVALVLMVWGGGSLATAQTPGAAATGSETDRLAALEKSSAEQTAAIAAAQSAGDNGWMVGEAGRVL